MIKEFEHKSGKMWLREDGVLQVEIKEGIEFTKSDADAFLAQKILWSKENFPLLVDYRHAHSTSVDVFVKGFAEVTKELKAAAYVVDSFLAQRVAEDEKSYLFEEIPAKVFLSMEEAESWLKSFLD